MAIIKRRNSDEAAEIQTQEAASQLEGNENPESTESDEAKNPPKVRIIALRTKDCLFISLQL